MIVRSRPTAAGRDVEPAARNQTFGANAGERQPPHLCRPCAVHGGAVERRLLRRVPSAARRQRVDEDADRSQSKCGRVALWPRGALGTESSLGHMDLTLRAN